MARNRKPQFDLTGKKFGRLTALYTIKKDLLYWICKCDCGNIVEVTAGQLRAGIRISCGCKHSVGGISRDATYRVWYGILYRCYNPKSTEWQYYGGKGIEVCKEWRADFANFLRDMGERPEGMVIDRILSDGDYCKANCRWVTPSQNTTNRHTHNSILIANLTDTQLEELLAYVRHEF